MPSPPPARGRPLQRFPHCCGQRGQTGFQVRAKMNSERPAAAFGQYLEVSPRLGGFDHSEGIFLSGHGKIGGIVTGHLQEDS